ncbi:MAG: lipocalin family protein [Candidatus Methylomirabilia bacterium]
MTVGSETFVVSGSTRSLARDDVGIQVLDHWQSPRDSTRYPSHWRLSVPPERLELEIRP